MADPNERRPAESLLPVAVTLHHYRQKPYISHVNVCGGTIVGPQSGTSSLWECLYWFIEMRVEYVRVGVAPAAFTVS